MSVLAMAGAGAMLMTLVLGMLFALGGVILVAYLLLSPVRRGLDGWMNRQEPDIWADTLACVDAQTVLSRRAKRSEPMWIPQDDRQQEPVFATSA